MRFHGKKHLMNYIIKIFGKAASTLTATNFLIGVGLNGNVTISKNGISINAGLNGYAGKVQSNTASSASTSSAGDTSKGNAAGSNSGGSGTEADSADQVYTVSQTTILSPQWISVYGNPLTRTFRTNDFVVKAPGSTGQHTFRGRIKSINGSTCQAVDDKMVTYTLYLGGGSVISSVNKSLPQPGDTIYWEGTNKPGGRATDYNIDQCICY
jgi:hypothetical protein